MAFDWKREELAWAGGLFEGEGSIGVARSGPNGSPRLQIWSSDKDIIERFSNIIRLGKMPDRPRPPGVLGNKELWVWHCTGHERVQAILAAIWPWLGKRRKSRAVEILKHGVSLGLSNKSRKFVNARRTHCTEGHSLSGDNRYVHPRGSIHCRKCKQSYMNKYYSENREKWH